MKRDYRLYLDDIIESMRRIESHLKGISKNQFMVDTIRQDAVVLLLGIIGEASRNIPRILKQKNSHIPWAYMINFRNLIAHEYYSMRLETVWDVATVRVKEIREGFETLKLV